MRTAQETTDAKLAYKHEDAAAALGVSPSTLARWRKSGLVKTAKVGGVMLYPKSQLEKLLQVSEGMENENGNP